MCCHAPHRAIRREKERASRWNWGWGPLFFPVLDNGAHQHGCHSYQRLKYDEEVVAHELHWPVGRKKRWSERKCRGLLDYIWNQQNASQAAHADLFQLDFLFSLHMHCYVHTTYLQSSLEKLCGDSLPSFSELKVGNCSSKICAIPQHPVNFDTWR